MRIIRIFLPVIVLGAAVFLLSLRTHGFKAFTIYSYELEKASPVGRPLPDNLYITIDNGNRIKLNSAVKGHYTLLSIVFLKCTNSCPIITGELNELYHDLYLKDDIADPAEKDISLVGNSSTPVYQKLQLMTLSFDGQHDNLTDIISYKRMLFNTNTQSEVDTGTGRKMQAMHFNEGQRWSFAVINSKSEEHIKDELSKIGFWFYETSRGVYNHSPYLYLINPEGIIKDVYDPGKLSTHELMNKVISDIN